MITTITNFLDVHIAMNFDCVDYPWGCTIDTPTFTGIPPHLTFLAEIKVTRVQFVRSW